MAEKEKLSEDEKPENSKEPDGISRRKFLKGTGIAVGGAAVGVGIGSLIGKEKEAEVIEKEVIKEVKVPVEVIKEVKVPAPPPTIKLNVNGQLYELTLGEDVNEWDTLAHTLRDTLKLTGTKIGCDRGECGMCTVIIDGKAVLSCSTLTVECEGKEITTIEGLANPETGALHPIQQAFIDSYGFQCGICTPGMIMTTKAFLDENPKPTEIEARQALAGNICRCTGYVRIIDSVLAASALIARTANLQLFSSSAPLTPGEEVVRVLAELFTKYHTWINAEWKFLPLPISLHTIDKMPPDKKKYAFAAFLPPTDFLLARAGGGPEKHKYNRAFTDLLFAANVSNGGWTFFTKDPELAADPRKLAGKVVGVVNAPEARTWGSPTLLSNAIFRDAWGIIDKVDQIEVSLPEVGGMFEAGMIDAAFWGMANNMSGTYTIPGPFIGLLRSSPTYWIPLTQEDVDKINAANPWKISLLTLPKDAIKVPGPPLQWTNPPDDVTMCDFGGALAVWKETEEDVVYEMLKFIVDNAERIKKAGLRMHPDPKKMAQWAGLTKDMVHPGALRFYKEYGINI